MDIANIFQIVMNHETIVFTWTLWMIPIIWLVSYGTFVLWVLSALRKNLTACDAKLNNQLSEPRSQT